MNHNKGSAANIIIWVVLGVLILGAGTYYFFANKTPKQVACTLEAKICPDGSAVGRTGPNCEFTECPIVKADETAGWANYTNTEYGLGFKYPAGFFDPNQEPKVLVGDCNTGDFPNTCPNINEIVAKDMASSGSDINAIKSNLSAPNYWKVPGGERATVNNVPYCLYQTQDAAMNHTYNSYYYATVTDHKCLIVNLNTSTTNCQVYLPLENGNVTQQKNYDACVATNQSQPTILSKIVSTFKLESPGAQETTPKIDSIVPMTGPKGITVEIKGTGLSGFEGDLNVFFERADGKKIMLTDTLGDYVKTADKLIRVKVAEPCQKGEKVIGEYSGIETVCDYAELTPGYYKVYTEPWGKKSNVVGFTITPN